MASIETRLNSLERFQAKEIQRHIDRVCAVFAARYPDDIDSMCQALEKTMAHGRQAQFTPDEQIAGDHFNEVLHEFAKGEHDGES